MSWGLQRASMRASKSRLDDLPLPAVVHWEGNHWVVVYRVDGNTFASPTRRGAFAASRARTSCSAGAATRPSSATRSGSRRRRRRGRASPGSSRSYGRIAARPLRSRSRDRRGDARARAADPDPDRRRPRPAAREPRAALDSDGGDRRCSRDDHRSNAHRALPLEQGRRPLRRRDARLPDAAACSPCR